MSMLEAIARVAVPFFRTAHRTADHHRYAMVARRTDPDHDRGHVGQIAMDDRGSRQDSRSGDRRLGQQRGRARAGVESTLMSLWSHEISADGRYRYRLRWCNDVLPARALVWIMLNPSTATAEKPDPTIRRVLRLTIEAGFHALEVVNLFAFRSKNPGLMLRAGDPVGPDNDRTIVRVLEKEVDYTGTIDVVEAWGAGAEHPKVDARVAELRILLRREGVTTRRHELGHTKDGHPWHPLQRGEKCTGLHPREAL